MPPAAPDNRTCTFAPWSTASCRMWADRSCMGCPTVMIGFMPAARVGDMLVCVGPPDVVAMGSSSVVIGGMPAARLGDMTAHGGVIVLGNPDGNDRGVDVRTKPNRVKGI